MWMTLSFRGDGPLAHLRASVVFGGLLVCSIYSAPRIAAQEAAPDAPRPARPARVSSTPSKGSVPRKPVEIRSVKVSRVNATTAKLAGEEFLRRASDPLVIEVRTQEPLGDLTRTSSPVIVLNGETLSETIPLAPNRLMAYLPDRKNIRRTNSVAVAWLGAEEITKSRRTVTFKADSIK
jgi:hypothetical protein